MRSALPFSLVLVLTARVCFAGDVTLTLDDRALEIALTSCVNEATYFLIDGSGPEARLSVVGSPAGDVPYTTIDVFLFGSGEDLRAGVSTGAIPLEGGGFVYNGVVEVSDGTVRELNLEVGGCE